MAKLSDLRAGTAVQFSPITDKNKVLAGEVADFIFLAVIKGTDGAIYYAHSDDIQATEQPVSEQLRAAIADEVAKQKTAAAPSAPPAAAAASAPPATAAPAPELPEDADALKAYLQGQGHSEEKAVQIITNHADKVREEMAAAQAPAEPGESEPGGEASAAD